MVDNPVADAFSHAASQYKKHDVVQRLSADLLQQFMLSTPQYASGHLVDIGCGPGTDFSLFSEVNQITAVDIAPQMLAQVKSHFPQYQCVCANVEHLFVANDTLTSHALDNTPTNNTSISNTPTNNTLMLNSANSIYSNLALQWCDDFHAAITQIQRLLRPLGTCHLAVVADGSLPELKALGFRVNQFMHMPSMLNAFGVNEHIEAEHCNEVKLAPAQKTQGINYGYQSNLHNEADRVDNMTGELTPPANAKPHATWQLLDAKVVKLTVYFEDLKSLLYSIKGVGASVVDDVNATSKIKPLSKSQWLKRIELAQGLRTAKGIPLTYHIALIHAQNHQ
ncbi:methyltransferase domain-containing protein [Shewanella sp. XMDDZSB0408]|nr:methyltransferase domain-containing protein [Shewanella sp. XMDDZSB0408]